MTDEEAQIIQNAFGLTDINAAKAMFNKGKQQALNIRDKAYQTFKDKGIIDYNFQVDTVDELKNLSYENLRLENIELASTIDQIRNSRRWKIVDKLGNCFRKIINTVKRGK